MDIDLPFVLTWAVLICGAIWLVDSLFFKPSRVAAHRAAPQQSSGDADADDTIPEPILVEYARSFFPVLLFVLVLRSFLGEPYQIPSESMVPTLDVGDFVLVNKYAYGLRLPVLGTKIVDIGEPARGDVMVFVPPHDPRYFIKRVIGLPGDQIRYVNKTLYINGERLPYEFVGDITRTHVPTGMVYSAREYTEEIGGRKHLTHRLGSLESPGEWEVPKGYYFMMGDNRDMSEDSRIWGFAAENQIVGKAVAVWLHKDPGLHWPTFERNRWLQEDE